MARKKRESSGGGCSWLNTFADLMNLLLCFFVMLFAMSDISSEKFESVSVSMANSIGIFDGGGSAVGEGQLISSGMSQLNNLGEYFSNMGQSSNKSGKDPTGSSSANDKEDSEASDAGSEKSGDEKSGDKSSGDKNSGGEKISEAKDTLLKGMVEESEKMYDNVSDLTDQYNLGDYVELSIDSGYQYVGLTLKGSILFESGKADIIEEAKPIMSKLGDVLAKFEGYTVEIIGHTDNVPIKNSKYKDNNWLSSARALNAAEYLINNKKLNPAKIKYSGRSEYEPIASNDTPEGRAKNRRIEIRIYNELSGK